MALAGTIKDVVPAVIMMSVSIFFLYITGAIYWAIIQDVVHKSRIGSISGFIHLVGSLSGIIGPIVTGFIVHHTGKFDSAFILAGPGFSDCESQITPGRHPARRHSPQG